MVLIALVVYRKSMNEMVCRCIKIRSKQSRVNEFDSVLSIDTTLGKKQPPTPFGAMADALAQAHDGSRGHSISLQTPSMQYSNYSVNGNNSSMMGTPPIPTPMLITDGMNGPGVDANRAGGSRGRGGNHVWDEWVAEQKGSGSLSFSLKKSSSSKKLGRKKSKAANRSNSGNDGNSSGMAAAASPIQQIATPGSASSVLAGVDPTLAFQSGPNNVVVRVGGRILRSFGGVDYPAQVTLVDHSTGCCDLVYDDGNVESGVAMGDVRPDPLESTAAQPQQQPPPQPPQQQQYQHPHVGLEMHTPANAHAHAHAHETVAQRFEQAAEGLVHDVASAMHMTGGGSGTGSGSRGSGTSASRIGGAGGAVPAASAGSSAKKRFEL